MRYSKALHEYEKHHISKRQYLYELEKASLEGFTDLMEDKNVYRS